ncbi:MAG: YdeI/OmpD-associated family protein [Dermatophilaceae bacterium]
MPTNKPSPATSPRSMPLGSTADPDAAAFWAAAIPSYRTSCVWWVVSAKQEVTRQRRFDQLLAACAAYDLIPPQRYGAVPAWLTRLRATRPDA